MTFIRYGWLLLALLLVGCQELKTELARYGNVGATLGDAFIAASPEEEQQAGREASAVLLGAAPVLKDARVNAYVNRVGLWVALHSTGADLSWRFAVLDDPDINAFAAPGGYVFITKGLLARLQNEAELAAVLAHEIAHVTQQHHLAALRKEARMKLAGMVASAALEDGQEKEYLARLAQGAKTVYSRGLDRKDEHDADALAVVLTARAGYDPYALLAVLHTLSTVNADSREMSLLLKTHPAPSERLARLDQAMAGQLDSYGRQALGEARFQRELSHLVKR